MSKKTVKNNPLEELFGNKTVEEILNDKTTSDNRVERSSRVRARGGKVKMDEQMCKALCQSIGIEYREGYENRVVERVFTDETVDRYGDIVKADGGDLVNFKKNPVVLMFHDSRKLPVGASIKTWYDPERRAIIGWLLFFDSTVDASGVSETAFQYCVSGALKTVSIGFLPKSMQDIYRPTDEERKEFGMPPEGVIFKKWELLEISVTPVPANPNARSIDLLTKDGIRQAEDSSDLLQVLLIAEMEDVLHVNDTIPEDIGYEDAYDFFQLTAEILEEGAMGDSNKEHIYIADTSDKYEKSRKGTQKYGEKEYFIIFGKIKGKDIWEEWAYCYPKDTWKADEIFAIHKEFKGVLSNGESSSPVVCEITFKNEVRESINLLITKQTLVADKLDRLSDAIEKFSRDVRESIVSYHAPQGSGDQADDDDIELSAEQVASIVADVRRDSATSGK